MVNDLLKKAANRLIGQSVAGQITTPVTRISVRYQDLDTDHTLIAAPGVGKRIVIPSLAMRNASTTSNPFVVFSDGLYNVNGLNELIGFKVNAGANAGINPNTTAIPLTSNTFVNVRNVTATGAGNPDIYLVVYYYIEMV